MRRKSVFLSAASNAFCVERSQTTTAAFELLGLRYMFPIYPYGCSEGAGVELLGLLSPLILLSPSF